VVWENQWFDDASIMLIKLSIDLSYLTEGEGMSNQDSRVDPFALHCLKDQLVVVVRPKLSTINGEVLLHKGTNVEVITKSNVVPNEGDSSILLDHFDS